MDASFWMQLAVVMVCVGVGGRLGGVGLGAAGGLGVCILVLFLGCYPGDPPTSVLLIIVAVIACTSLLQGTGGLDLLVHWAENLLRLYPRAIVITGPLVCGFFVILVGTSYVAFAICRSRRQRQGKTRTSGLGFRYLRRHRCDGLPDVSSDGGDGRCHGRL